MSNLIDLEISITSVHTLQQSGIWDLQDIIEMMNTHPATTTLALAKIKYDDFVVITEAIKKKQENV
jgi:hypothetical protein